MMKYILFGAGIFGAAYYDLYKDKYDIACFADSDGARQGGKCKGLDVISPDAVPGLVHDEGMSVVITSNCHFDIAWQLYEMGIKDFYVPSGFGADGITHVDLSACGDIITVPNKICVLGLRDMGVTSSALAKSNTLGDLEIVEINGSRIDSDFYYQYFTSSLVITHGAEPCGGKLSIELWHGFPVKALWYASGNPPEQEMAGNMHNRFSGKQAVCSLSKLYSIFLGYCLRLDYERFYITGYPRNDSLLLPGGRDRLEKLTGQVTQKHIVFYLPTFRDALVTKDGGDKVYIFDMPGFDAAEFNGFLRENDILFVYKMHGYALRPPGHAENTAGAGNMRELTDAMLLESGMDLYEALGAADCLISDYSSVIIDYLLTDKPIILTPLDLQEYSRTRGIMTEPYDAWMPGVIASDYKQLTAAMTDALLGGDRYAKDRERLRRIMHFYTDGNSSRRVLDLARSLLGLSAEAEKDALISVIVPAYNVGPYIKKCLDSVLAQTYSSLEVIVINDGSSDNTLDIIKTYTSDPRIKLINQGNSGVAAARNAGIEAAAGEYLAFADSDDYIEPDMYEKLHQAITGQNADIAVCDYNLVYDGHTETRYSGMNDECINVRDNVNDYFYKYCACARPNNYIWTRLIRTDTVRKSGVRFTDHSLGDDTLFTFSLLPFINRVAHISGGYYNYLQRPDSNIYTIAKKTDLAEVYASSFSALLSWYRRQNFAAGFLPVHAYTRLRSIFYYSRLAGMPDEDITDSICRSLPGTELAGQLADISVVDRYARVNKLPDESAGEIKRVMRAAAAGDAKGLIGVVF